LASGESEFEAAGLATAPSRIVDDPRVAASPAALECRVVHSMRLHDVDGKPVEGWIAIGQVVGVHIDDAYLRNGRFDTAAAQPLARCGYRDYAAVAELFEALRPTDGGAFLPGQTAGGDSDAGLQRRAALDLASLAAGRAAVMRQKSLDGVPIAIGERMRVLVGPSQGPPPASSPSRWPPTK
jgi:Flavin reductase like domain